MGQSKGRTRSLVAIIAAAGACLLPVLPTHGQQTAPSTTNAPPVFTPPATIDQDIETLTSLLNNETAPQDERDEAARRLQSRNQPQARQILRDALISTGNPGAQLAAARALIGVNQPADEFRDPLFALIGRGRQHSEAAALALASYKTDPEVVRRLIEIAQNNPNEGVRLAGIRALGMLVEKRAAAALVNLLGDANEPNTIHAAAADALVNMTGLRTNGRSPQRWQQWFQRNASLEPAQWKLSILDDRASRFDRLQQRHDLLADEVQALIAEQYQQSSDDAQRTAAVLRLLRSPSPTVRAAGAGRVYTDMVQGLRVAPEVQAHLRSLIGDSDREVRAAVAQALFTTVDLEAVDPLLVQLQQEADAEVKAAIVRALAKIGEPRVIGTLQELLRDESQRVSEAAADALKEFGRTLRERDPARATQTALQLRALLEQDAGRQESPRFREAVIDAMGAMREPQLGSYFIDLLRQSPSAGEKKALLRSLGALRDRNFAGAIGLFLDDADVGVRAEAAAALQYTASPADIPRLLPRLDPNTERSEPVRNAVWRAIEGVLPEMRPDELKNLADRFASDPARRATIQEKRRDVLLKERGQEEELAFARQDLGNTYIELGQPEKAAVEFAAALDYWSTAGAGMQVNQLVSQLLEAQLKAGRYTDAAAFAAKMIRSDTGFQDVVGPMIRDEAERLVQSGSDRDALTLIAAVEKMDPPLARRFTAPLEAIRARAAQQGG